jgi:formylglycine-generating enzyme required for sulfatase activity
MLLALAVATLAQRYFTSQRFYRDGLAHLERYRELRSDMEALEVKAKEARGRLQSWEPVWEHTEELEILDLEARMRRELELSYDQAALSFCQALDSALPATGVAGLVEERLGGLYFERYLELLRGESSPEPEAFKGMIESLSLPAFRRRFEAHEVALTTDPPGAEVYFFRYELVEGRLFPFPFDPRLVRSDPREGIVGAPYLIVEAVDDRQRFSPPLAPLDRILQVGGESVSMFTDLARSLSTALPDQRFEVLVARGQSTLTLSWVPFPRERLQAIQVRGEDARELRTLEPGRVVHLLEQFGCNLAAYPLALDERCRLGVTRIESATLTVLPRGSYLLVFRKEGHVEVRLPLSVPPEEEAQGVARKGVRLLLADAVPPGFVYVPEGPVSYGGDRGVDEEGLEGGSRSIRGYFLGRCEVTVEEYLAFLNDPDVLPTIERETGMAPSRLEPGERVAIVPCSAQRLGGVRLLCELDPEVHRWRFTDRSLEGEKPVLGVAAEAARDYARWLTENRGGKWVFRLPTDLEWEKAARGVDRRAYVWGNEPVLSFCRSWHGTYGASSRPEPVGTYPFDESLFGVRDMAGSVSEPVEGKSSLGFPVFRGGSWNQPDAQYYRIANREGRKSGVGVDVGIRLAADLAGR